jgi:N-acetylneuraminic acid mutarotase
VKGRQIQAPRRRRRGARARRRRLAPLLAAGAALVAVLVVLGRSGSGGGSAAPAAAARTLAVARLAPPLPAPVSSESAAPVRGGVLILGGLDAAGASAGGVFRLDAASGRLSPAGALSEPLHDAAAAALGGRVLVFGGGAEASTDAVQSLAAPGSTAAPDATASVVGRLPTVRSDLSAVALGGRAYLLGGYDGRAPLGSVLATADGSSFSRVATLPVPARYVAAAALGGRIYAFGGETASGAATDAIREVDPRSGAARLTGRLPEALSHAAAVTLGGSIYLLGGEAAGDPLDRIWRFDPATGRAAPAGRLPLAVAGGAATVLGRTAYLIGGTGRGGGALRTVITLRLRPAGSGAHAATPQRPAARGRGSPPPPFEGRLLIADRGNNRLLVVDARKHVLWRFPSRGRPAPPGGFYFPDDAFFTHGGTRIITNEEQNERIVQLSFPAGKLLWSYGHPGVAGSEPGYLHEPDDAYLWRSGAVSVSDAQNCRVLLISPRKKILHELGSPASCAHEPPRAFGSPNGDTPLADGNILVSEVNGSYVDEVSPGGRLVWSAKLPISYPSDAQQVGPDRYLVADYADPGGVYEFDRRGRILWSFHPASGPGMLNHPSLAERLPGGLIAIVDDYRDRVLILDPRRRRIVWQYGRTDRPGRGPGLLNTPDGFDLLAPNGTTPTHPHTG